MSAVLLLRTLTCVPPDKAAGVLPGTRELLAGLGPGGQVFQHMWPVRPVTGTESLPWPCVFGTVQGPH